MTAVAWVFFFYNLTTSGLPTLERSHVFIERRDCESLAVLTSDIPGYLVVGIGGDSWLACRQVPAR